MAKARMVSGFAALAGLALTLNLVAVRRDPFSGAVLALAALAAVFSIVWLALTMVSRADKAPAGGYSGGLNSIVASLIVLGICIVVYAFFLRWDRAWDLTEEGRTELAPQTVQVLEGLTQDVHVFGLFVNTGRREVTVARDKTRVFLDRCAALTPHLKVEFIDPQQEAARLKALGLTFADPNGTVVVKAGTRQKSIAFAGPMPRLEERDFTNALINVVQASQPKLGFLTGHGENDISKPTASGLKALLQSEGYQLEAFGIQSGGAGIDPSYNAVVINGLNAEVGGDLSDDELNALDTYLNSGGRLMVLVDPQFAATGQPARKRAFEWLARRFGVVVGEDIILTDSRVNSRVGQITLLSDAAATAEFGRIEVPNVEFMGCFDQSHPITRNFDKQLDFLAARSVSVADPLPKNVVASRILRTLPYCYAETDLQGIAAGRQPTQGPGENVGSIGVAVAATMQTDVPVGDTGQMRAARLVVVGDSDFVRNEAVLIGGNLNFILNAVAWLTEREELIAIRARGKDNPAIVLSERDEKIIAWVSGLGVVQALLVVALAVFFMRRRYQ